MSEAGSKNLSDLVKSAIEAFHQVTHAQHPNEAITAKPGGGSKWQEPYITIDTLNTAKALVFMKSFKVGAIISYKGGHGFVIKKLKQEGREITWSAPSILTEKAISAGLTIGAAEVMTVLVLGDKGAAAAAAGESHAAVGSDINLIAWYDWAAGEGLELQEVFADHNETQAFSSGDGLIGDLSLKGSVMKVDEYRNKQLYGEGVTPAKILSGDVKPPSEIEPLFAKITEFMANPPAHPPPVGVPAPEPTPFRSGRAGY